LPTLTLDQLVSLLTRYVTETGDTLDLLLIGALPFWGALRHRSGAQSALKGVNATVVGILLCALYTPVWTSAIFGPADFGLVGRFNDFERGRLGRGI